MAMKKMISKLLICLIGVCSTINYGFCEIKKDQTFLEQVSPKNLFGSSSLPLTNNLLTPSSLFNTSLSVLPKLYLPGISPSPTPPPKKTIFQSFKPTRSSTPPPTFLEQILKPLDNLLKPVIDLNSLNIVKNRKLGKIDFSIQNNWFLEKVKEKTKEQKGKQKLNEKEAKAKQKEIEREENMEIKEEKKEDMEIKEKSEIEKNQNSNIPLSPIIFNPLDNIKEKIDNFLDQIKLEKSNLTEKLNINTKEKLDLSSIKESLNFIKKDPSRNLQEYNEIIPELKRSNDNLIISINENQLSHLRESMMELRTMSDALEKSQKATNLDMKNIYNNLNHLYLATKLKELIKELKKSIKNLNKNDNSNQFYEKIKNIDSKFLEILTNVKVQLIQRISKKFFYDKKKIILLQKKVTNFINNLKKQIKLLTKDTNISNMDSFNKTKKEVKSHIINMLDQLKSHMKNLIKEYDL